MTDHAALLREAATAIRPMIEDDLDKREIYAAWRKKFSDAGLDWMAFKSLQKAHVEDDRDESGDGKRVAKIMDRLDCTAAYAEMLGYGSAKMNENNCFSGSYADAKGRGVDAAFVNSILVGGELTDSQEQIGGNGTDLPVETATEKQAACSDRPDSLNSSEPPRSNTAGEAPSSSQASPAAPSDEPFKPVAFLRKSAADYRPHCLRPDTCAATGLKHCYTCQKAVEADAVPA